MSKFVRISDGEHALAVQVARKHYRSVNAQVEYWVKIGRRCLNNPELSILQIKERLDKESDH